MNTTTSKLAVLAAGFLIASGAAQATTATYNFKTGGTNSANSAYGNDRTFTASGSPITVTASAWSISPLTGNFAEAQLGRATNVGLWICNQSEGINCSSPSHQVDNYYGFDFILFQFSAPVDPASLNITTYNQADLDVTYYLGNAASGLDLTNVSLAGLAGLGFGNAINDDVNTYATSRTVYLTNNTGVNSLLVGARVGGDSSKDYFKLSAMKVDSVSDVPEPSTVALTGFALAALGLYGRRRKA